MGTKNHQQGVLGIRLEWWLFAVFAFLFCLFLVEIGSPPSSVFPGPVTSNAASLDALGGSEQPHQQENRVQRLRTKGRTQLASYTLEEVQTLACRLANERANDLYGCQPFTRDSSPVRVDTGWLWLSRRALPTGDLEAIVRLGFDGTVEELEVLYLQSVRGF